MRTTSAARTTTERIPREASSLGPAIHPGEILLEEFLKPLDMTQAAAAKTLGMSTVRLNELVRGKRESPPTRRSASRSCSRRRRSFGCTCRPTST